MDVLWKLLWLDYLILLEKAVVGLLEFTCEKGARGNRLA